jgi:hypothetical protein
VADTIRVVLYGSSLYMAGLAASLKTNPSLNVIHIHAGSPAFEHCRQAQVPAAFVFDLGEMSADLALSQLRACPGLMLIGVDAASEDILVLSGQRARALTMNDLAQLITVTDTGGPPSSPTEPGSSTGQG